MLRLYTKIVATQCKLALVLTSFALNSFAKLLESSRSCGRAKIPDKFDKSPALIEHFVTNFCPEFKIRYNNCDLDSKIIQKFCLSDEKI